MTRRLAPLALLLATACGAPARPAATPAAEQEAAPEPPFTSEVPKPGAQPRQLGAEEPFRTAAGTTFTVAAGWWVTEMDPIMLEDPDRELRSWIVDVPSAKSRAEAIAAAWKRAVPDFALKIAQDEAIPGRQGW